MRKNRYNNGYVGKKDTTQFVGGNVSTSKVQTEIQPYLNGYYKPSDIPVYVRPTNGNGYGARAQCVLKEGVLTSVRVITTGSAYTSDPIVTLYGDGVTSYAGVTRTANTITAISPWFSITSIQIIQEGSGYGSTPTVSFSAPTNGTVSCTGSISGTTLTVTAVTTGVLYPGQLITGTGIASNTIITGYISGTGSTGTYTVNNSQTVGSIAISGTGTATGTATVTNGVLTQIQITYAGAKYTTPPTITISGGSPKVAAAAIAKIRPDTGVYTAAPSVTITGGGGSGAVGEAQISGKIGTITLTAGGTGYTEVPTVFFGDTIGLQAIGTATISGGAVTGITLTSGQNVIWNSAPPITIGGWKPLPTLTAGEQKFVGTFAVYDNDSNIVGINCSGNYTVDWGDGSAPVNYSTNTTASKIYDTVSFANITNQDTFRNYKTVTITVTPQAGQNLTKVDLHVRHPSFSVSYVSQFLDIKIVGSSLNTLGIGSNIGYVYPYMLEQFEYVGTNSISNFIYLFLNCYGLKNVVALHKGTATNFANMFQNCYSLEKAPDLDTSSATSTNSMFNSCYNLKYVPVYNTSNCTFFSSMFASCFSLVVAPPLDTRKCTTGISSMFNACYNLKIVPNYDLTAATDVSSFFASCYSLEEVPQLSIPNATTISGIFSGCYSLKSVPEILTTGKLTNASSAFSNCISLKSAPLFNTSAVTNFANMLQNCYTLKEVPEYDTGNATNLSTMFSNCYSLLKVPNFNTKNCTNFSTMFSGCSSLSVAPNLDTSNATDLNTMFQLCYSLQYVPTLNCAKTTSLLSTFSGCYTIREVPYLKTENCLTMSSLFSGCYCLTGVTMSVGTPTVGTQSSTQYNQMFNNCYSLTEVRGLTTSGGANTTIYSNMFGQFSTQTCPSLSRIQLYGINQNINVSSSRFGATALNEIYSNLAVVGASGAGAKTITVSSNFGTANDNPAIAIAKGWTVTG